MSQGEPERPFAVISVSRNLYVLDTEPGRESLTRYGAASREPEAASELDVRVLALLVRERGRVVTYEQFKESNPSLTALKVRQGVSGINKLWPEAIANQHGTGYRLMLEVELLSEAARGARLRAWFADQAPSLLSVREGFVVFLETLGRYFDGQVAVQRWVALLFALAPFASLVSWNLLCRLLGWPYWMGRSELLQQDVRLQGFHSFGWGFATTLPVIVAARLVDYSPRDLWHRSRRFLAHEVPVITAYALSGGLAGFGFYHPNVRGWIEAFGWSYLATEVVLVFLWSSWMAVATASSFYLTLEWTPGTFRRALALAWFSVFLLTVPAVSAFVWLVPDTGDFEQARGLLAHLAMTAGLVCGAVLTLQETAPEAPQRRFELGWLRSPSESEG